MQLTQTNRQKDRFGAFKDRTNIHAYKYTQTDHQTNIHGPKNRRHLRPAAKQTPQSRRKKAERNCSGARGSLERFSCNLNLYYSSISKCFRFWKISHVKILSGTSIGLNFSWNASDNRRTEGGGRQSLPPPFLGHC